MKIFAKDNLTWIEMTYETDDAAGYSAYRMGIVADLKHSKFSAANLDLHFLNMGAFRATLGQLVTDERSEAMLIGTYDSYIRVKGPLNKASLEYRLGSAVYDHGGTRDLALTGSFALDEPNVKHLLSFAEEHEADV